MEEIKQKTTKTRGGQDLEDRKSITGNIMDSTQPVEKILESMAL